MIKAANDQRIASDSDEFFWCDCGRANYWIWRNPETQLYHIICSQCEADHTMQVYRDGR